MIQKKYMWGLVLGLLGSCLLVNDIFSMRGQGLSVTAVGSAKFNSMSEDQQIKFLEGGHSREEILKYIEDGKVKRPGVISYFKRDQQQMTQTPVNLYRTYQEQYQGQYWSDFYGVYQSVLDGMNIRSASDLERAARKGNEDDQGDQNLGGDDGDSNVKKDDLSGSEDKGEEKVGGSGAGDSSGVTASRDEIAAAFQALLKLSEKLTLSKPITNQDEWKAFCNAFADLVESGNWKPDQAYSWDGSKLQ